MSAQLFYSACLSEKLSLKDISIDKKGKVQQKLAVLPYLPELLYHNCMVGDFINSGIAISADIPVTLYNENVKKLTQPTCKVLAIFSKNYNDAKYDVCTYLTKSYSIERFTDDIKKCLVESLYKAKR